MVNTRLAEGHEHRASSIVSLFHQVNRLVPDEQALVILSPDASVESALELMTSRSYSQVPVVEGSAVLGLFSYRSLSNGIKTFECSVKDVLAMEVAEFLEQPPYLSVHDELARLAKELDQSDAVLVGNPNLLQAILTPMDVVRYLLDVADAFVLLGEIELALRALIMRSVTDKKLYECIRRSLTHYSEDGYPKNLEECTFGDYIAILRDGRNWGFFEAAFGGTRDLARARLEPVNKIRNEVFHFRKPELGVSILQHQQLVSCRNWLLNRARIMEAREEKGKNATQ